jgi:hypothetical protein
MNREQVIRAFFRKEVAKTPLREVYDEYRPYKGRTLEVKISRSDDGDVIDLINYSTRIASIVSGYLYLNTKKYSSTTSHIQSMIKRLATEYGYTDIRELVIE